MNQNCKIYLDQTLQLAHQQLINPNSFDLSTDSALDHFQKQVI